MYNIETKINRLLGFELNYEDHLIIWEFVVLWNYFERNICKKEFRPDMVEDYVKVINQKSIDSHYDYFRTRYVCNTSTNSHFERLFPSSRGRKEEVKNLLLGKENASLDKASAIILIVYRLRCNLFHGIKTADMLKQQEELFRQACIFLIDILESN